MPSKSGAVLWFLHRHAPMPNTIAGQQVYGADEALGAMPALPSPSKTPSEASRRSISSPKGIQRDFLHRAVVAIGAEIDEGKRCDESAFQPFDAKPLSVRQRDRLRQGYAAHADAECEKLQDAVEKKEKEVEKLRRKVKDMQRTLEQTKAAAERRKRRLQSEGGGIAGLVNMLDGSKQSQTKGPLESMYNSEVDSSLFGLSEENSLKAAEAARRKEQERMAEMQQNMGIYVQEENALWSKVEDVRKQVSSQTLCRKAAEAALCIKQSEIIQLRSRTHVAEARSHRLTLELKRVYSSLPKVVQQRLEQSVDARAALEEQQLADLKTVNRRELFKFKDNTALEDLLVSCNDDIDEVLKRKKRVAESVASGESGLQLTLHMHRVEVALNCLLEVWKKLDVEGKDEASTSDIAYQFEACDEAEDLLQEASSTVGNIHELLRLQTGRTCAPVAARIKVGGGVPPH